MERIFSNFAPDPADEQAAYSLSRTDTRDADEQASRLSEWDQMYEQLTPGPFDGRLVEIWFRGIQVFREITSQSVHESGLARPGARVMGIPVQMEGTGHFCGRPMGSDDIITLEGGEALDLRTPPRLDVAAVSVPVETLRRYAREIEHLDIDEALRGKFVLRPPKERSDAFRQFLLTVLNSVSATPGMLQHATMQKTLEQAILSNLVKVSAEGEGARKQPPPPTSRHALVTKAQDYMREHVDEALTVEDLCREFGVSRRTLQYSFQEVLQLNPVSYLRALRLNGVRRMLRTADPRRLTVQDIAARWGFWHLSHFAADYKHMFGELPSDTLKASRAGNL